MQQQAANTSPALRVFPVASPNTMSRNRVHICANIHTLFAPLLPTAFQLLPSETLRVVSFRRFPPQVAQLKLPRRKLEDLYEQIILARDGPPAILSAPPPLHHHSLARLIPASLRPTHRIAVASSPHALSIVPYQCLIMHVCICVDVIIHVCVSLSFFRR